MFEALLEPLGREALGRVTLLLNHVLSAEPEATRRLSGQVSRTIGVQWHQWPAMLPPPPRAVWSISPAGLLDLDEDMLLVPVGVGDDQTLMVTLDGTALLGWVFGGMAGRPPMDIRGDAGLAAEVSWLAENLRWDIEDDLARVVGDGPARVLGQLGSGLAQAVGAFVQRVRGAA
jgi:ubiquinone biosynthesis protein UbiJ